MKRWDNSTSISSATGNTSITTFSTTTNINITISILMSRMRMRSEHAFAWRCALSGALATPLRGARGRAGARFPSVWYGFFLHPVSRSCGFVICFRSISSKELRIRWCSRGEILYFHTPAHTYPITNTSRPMSRMWRFPQPMIAGLRTPLRTAPVYRLAVHGLAA